MRTTWHVAMTADGVAEKMCKWVNENPDKEVVAMTVSASVAFCFNGIIFYREHSTPAAPETAPDDSRTSLNKKAHEPTAQLEKDFKW